MQMPLQLHDDALWRQRTAREVRRTHGLASPTLEARVEVEPPLPRELLELRDPQTFRLLDVLDRADGPARRQLREEDVEWRRHEVTEIRVRDRRDESDREHRVEEP